MEYRKFDNKVVVRIDKGEEMVTTLHDLCRELKIKLGSITGIGAVNRATIGLFEPTTKKYHSQELKGDYEITSLNGNISTMKGETYLHLHISLGDIKYNTYGGHLNLAVVSATSEVIIDIIEGELDRQFDEEIGLNLLKF